MSKPTMATIKSFVRKNEGRLFIRVKSSFNGMTDCVEQSPDRGFHPVASSDLDAKTNTLGIRGAWFVGRSRDSIDPLSEPGFTGFHIYNCCGSFDLAVQSEAA